MARGRIIDAVISNSRKVNSLSDQAALLFTWAQAHTDDYGRIEGETQDVLFLIVPRRGWDEAQVEGYLREIWEAGLFRQYHDAGRRYFEVVGFDEHQTFRSDRSRKGKYPQPSGYDTQWDTDGNQREKTDGEVKLSEAKLSEAKVKRKTVVGKPTTAPEQEPKAAKGFTPKEKAQRFFEGVVDLKAKKSVPWLHEFLTAIAAKNAQVSKASIWIEIMAFSEYWTELTHSGIKQRWECQKTFEVEKRLVTWFSRAGFKGFSSAGAFAGQGKAKTIIGLDEDDNE